MPAHRKDLKIKGANLWYLVGLITSDGCLSPDGRHIDITSHDPKFLQCLKEKLNIGNKVTAKYNTRKQRSFHIQIGNTNFYDFLLSVGLTQNKSLTLGEINVPDKYFTDFLRGLIDGDGCLRKWRHPSNDREQWSLRVYSGSRKFLAWLSKMVGEFLKSSGKIYRNDKRVVCYVLKFGKMAAREILKCCYYKGCFGLARKIKLANECLDSYRGWCRSKTIEFTYVK